ncbi:MAG: UV DNA damage repair endonuclease UvsE, partial [Tetragenococcus halophilus]|nr:UV DNA damage repair endonuclease UvsE [Tetragenococcus halophilus]
MKIGYACIVKGVPGLKYKTCRKKNATKEKLMSLIEHNLMTLEKMMDYNYEQGIKLFRISSDIIPFGSDFEVNDLDWVTLFEPLFNKIGCKINQYNIRVSMHPGQYTVLNSPRQDVVDRALNDLKYHTLFLDSLGVQQESKIILHVGGVYNDKPLAIEKFVSVYKQLDKNIKKRLVIENDDVSYTIKDVLELSSRIDIPVVYDNLHYRLNNDGNIHPDSYWISKAKCTWGEKDGRAKVHYSQQQIDAREGSHSKYIRINDFMRYFEDVKECHVDIMLEVKDKNLSVKKCQLATSKEKNIKSLENEWARYKYTVLERSPAIYQDIKDLLKDKTAYPVIQFYQLIESALDEEIEINKAI